MPRPGPPPYGPEAPYPKSSERIRMMLGLAPWASAGVTTATTTAQVAVSAAAQYLSRLPSFLTSSPLVSQTFRSVRDPRASGRPATLRPHRQTVDRQPGPAGHDVLGVAPLPLS